MREIKELRWARSCQRPGAIPIGRPRGAKAKGICYERALAEVMPAARSGAWFEFEDRNGHGYCQTDLLLGWAPWVVIFEVKLSSTIGGFCQLELLYRPVVEMALGRKVLTIQVCKNIRPEVVKQANALVYADLNKALLAAAGDLRRRRLWHWIGSGVVPRIEPFLHMSAA